MHIALQPKQTRMKRLLPLALIIAVTSCSDAGNHKLTVNGKDYSWIADSSQSNPVDGAGYTIFYRKGNKILPKRTLIGIRSDSAVAQIKRFEEATKSLEGSRSFFVEFDKEEFVKYLETAGGGSGKFRVYFSRYANGYKGPNNEDLSGKFSAVLVATKDEKEMYNDGNDNEQVINIGTLCPTNCPKNDTKSLHTRAGLPIK